MWNEENNII